MRAGAHQEGQRGVGTKGQGIVENTKNPSVHVSHRQVLQDRQGKVHWEMGAEPAVHSSSLCGWWHDESWSRFHICVCPGASMGGKVLVI